MIEIAAFFEKNWSVLLLLGIGIPASIIDIRKFRIPDYLTFSALPTGFLLHLFLSPEPWWFYLLNATAGFSVFFIIRLASRGKLGWGDIKYAAVLSALMGFLKWVDSCCLAVLLALLYVILTHLFKKSKKADRIPFAPFMTGGAVLRILLMGRDLWTSGSF